MWLREEKGVRRVCVCEREGGASTWVFSPLIVSLINDLCQQRQKGQPSSVKQSTSHCPVISYITDSLSCLSPLQLLVHLPSSDSAVISSIVAGNLSQALPVEPDHQVALGPRLTGSSRHLTPTCSERDKERRGVFQATALLQAVSDPKDPVEQMTPDSWVWQLCWSPDHYISCSPPLFHGGLSPSPVIPAVYMSNVRLMDVGEASIKLIVDHWVNFSYLENPSFLKCCECGGCDRRLCAQTEGWLASNTALRSGTTFMGFTGCNDGDDEVLVRMIVLVWLFSFNFKQWYILCFILKSDVSSWSSPAKYYVLYLFLYQWRFNPQQCSDILNCMWLLICINSNASVHSCNECVTETLSNMKWEFSQLFILVASII